MQSRLHSHRCTRNRKLYALGIAVVIVCGLTSRSESLALPAFVAKYAGDTLWALMIFFGLGILLRTWRTTAITGLAVLVCATIEGSQLYHAPWIDAVRRTWFGRMALGDTFAWGDLAAYLVGITFGGAIEWAACRLGRNAARTESGASQ